MSHTPTSTQRAALSSLEEACQQLCQQAATQFPEGGTDAAKWEWARVLAMVVFEAAKRRNLPAAEVVKRALHVVKRRLERERAADILAWQVPEFPKEECPGEQDPNPD